MKLPGRNLSPLGFALHILWFSIMRFILFLFAMIFHIMQVRNTDISSLTIPIPSISLHRTFCFLDSEHSFYSLLYSTDFLFPKIKCLILDTIGLLCSVLVRRILRIIRNVMPSNLSTVFIQGQCHSSLCHAAILIISPPLQVLHFKQNIRENSQMQSVQQSSRNRKLQAWLFNCHHQHRKCETKQQGAIVFAWGILSFSYALLHPSKKLSVCQCLCHYLSHPTASFSQCLYVCRL